MWKDKDVSEPSRTNSLSLEDLSRDVTACALFDPGQDESPDPDEFPPDPEDK